MSFNTLRAAAGIALSILMAGCFGSSNDTVGNNQMKDDASKPLTDAFIEYGGPHEKWAGPETMIAHLQARGGEQATLSIIHSKFRKEGVPHSVSVESAREQLNNLYDEVKLDDKQWTGCLSPVKVRLIRSDGVVITRQGCRGQEGWPSLVSEVTHLWIELAVQDVNASMGHKKSH